MINWSLLKTAGFWLAPQSHALTGASARILLIIFGVCLIAAIVLAIVKEKKSDAATRKFLKKFQSLLTALGLVGFVILFFFWQNIPYLSSRYWLIIWLLIGIVWLFFIGRFGFIEAPQIRAVTAERKKIEQYLPKRKRK